MAYNYATILLLFAYATCMEMRETVERMVMVRTTGSDLQPAATGYIYKKKSDGPVSVTKMGETEVMEQLSKLYEKPERYKAPAPTPAGPFYGKEEDGTKAASNTNEELVKPVVEAEQNDDPIDGIVDEDYDKMFQEFAKPFDNYRNYFGNHFHGLNNYDHGVYHGKDGLNDFGSRRYRDFKGHEGYQPHHHFGKADDGHYESGKYKGYSISSKGTDGKKYGEGDAEEKHFIFDHGHNGDDHDHASGDSEGEYDGFHKVFDDDEFKKDDDFYGKTSHKGGLHKYGIEDGIRSNDGGYENDDSDESDYHEKGFSGHQDEEFEHQHDSIPSSNGEGDSKQDIHKGFGVKEHKYDGKSYSYKIKH